MKIGIVTWFHYENYGTKLQAIALQHYIRKLGHEVELINFYPPEPPKKSLRNSTPSEIVKKIKNRINKIILHPKITKYTKQIKEHSQKLSKIIDDTCILSPQITNKKDYINVCNSYDLLIFGSDQIWNPNWYHPYYYANFDEINTKRIGYAPSLGVSKLTLDESSKLKSSLIKFENVYIREKSGAKIVSSLLNKDIQNVVDPTLLLSNDEWIEILNIKKNDSKKYVLCYFLGDNKNHWRAVSKFVKDKNLDLKIIPSTLASYNQKGDIQANSGVEDFTKLIYNAAYIITDSFHGTIFSIIFKKQFYTFERFSNTTKSSQNARIHDLLNDLNLNNRLLQFDSVEINNDIDIDYKKTMSILNEMTYKSKALLSSNLK